MTIDNMDSKKLIEAALFISTDPLKLQDLSRLSGLASLGNVKDVIKDLEKKYSDSAIEILENSDGWQMQVRPEFMEKVSDLTPYSDLPEGCKRTLAIVVYKEPVQQAEIIKIQGNKAYTYIKHLAKKGLVKTEKKGRTRILKVTQEFERYFGQPKAEIREKIRRAIEGEPEPEPVGDVPVKTDRPKTKKTKGKKKEKKSKAIFEQNLVKAESELEGLREFTADDFK